LDYPDFIIEDYGEKYRYQWSKHNKNIGYKENHTEGQHYWFCAEPRTADLSINNTKMDFTDGGKSGCPDREVWS
jgi:hypothetical protein